MVEIMDNATKNRRRAEEQKNGTIFFYDAGKGELHG